MKIRLFCLVIPVAVLIGLVTYSTTKGRIDAPAAATTTTTTPVNPNAETCKRFGDAITASAAGILSWDEMRAEMKTIYANSIGASSEVRTAARESLAALTVYDSAAFTTAGTKLGQACIGAGVKMRGGQA